MSDYENDSFQEEEPTEQQHLIWVTINVKSVNLNNLAALLSIKFRAQLDKEYHFETPDPTPISAKSTDTEIKKAITSYEFKVSKSTLHKMMKNKIFIDFIHLDRFSDEQTNIGSLSVEIWEIMNGKLAETAQSTCRAYDAFAPISKDGSSVGQAWIQIYLEDFGESQKKPT